jgi:hypothetical protein
MSVEHILNLYVWREPDNTKSHNINNIINQSNDEQQLTELNKHIRSSDDQLTSNNKEGIRSDTYKICRNFRVQLLHICPLPPPSQVGEGENGNIISNGGQREKLFLQTAIQHQ